MKVDWVISHGPSSQKYKWISTANVKGLGAEPSKEPN